MMRTRQKIVTRLATVQESKKVGGLIEIRQHATGGPESALDRVIVMRMEDHEAGSLAIRILKELIPVYDLWTWRKELEELAKAATKEYSMTLTWTEEEQAALDHRGSP